jgi:hypothetical protein
MLRVLTKKRAGTAVNQGLLQARERPSSAQRFYSRTASLARAAKGTRIMSCDGNLLWSIGLAIALTGVAAVTAVVDQKPQAVASAEMIAAQPIAVAQVNHRKTAGLGD